MAYSPSAYTKAMSRAGSGGGAEFGIFGRIMEAAQDVSAERNAEVARRVQKKTHEEEEKEGQKRAEEEKKGEELAHRLHHEEKDSLLAHRMEMEERKQLEREKQEKAALEAKDEEAAREFFEEEKKEVDAIKELADQDAKMAHELQSEEVKEVEAALRKLSEMWKKPAINAENVEGGIEISCHLPMLKSLCVDIEPDTKIIVIKAIPDFSELQERCSMLPKDMQLDDVKMTLDLKIVGKESVTPDEVSTEYDKTTSMCHVFVKNAYVKTDSKASFLRRMKTGLKRMMSKKQMES